MLPRRECMQLSMPRALQVSCRLWRTDSLGGCLAVLQAPQTRYERPALEAPVAVTDGVTLRRMSTVPLAGNSWHGRRRKVCGYRQAQANS